MVNFAITGCKAWGGWPYLAKQEAAKSDYHPYKIGSVALYKGRVVSYGRNTNKSHARLIRDFGYHSGTHAEALALMKAHKCDTLFVIRITKNGNISCSKPCVRCLAFAKQAGIEKIIYSDWSGNFREINI